jgi:hypothetical protein
MHIISKSAVNIYVMPEPVTSPFKVTQVTCGDLHANLIKLLYCLIRNRVISMEGSTYDKLVILYHTPPHEWSKSYLLALKSHIVKFKVINPYILVRLLGDELCDRGTFDLSILWFLEEFIRQNGLIEILASNHGFDFIRFCELAKLGLLQEPIYRQEFNFLDRHENQYSQSLHNLESVIKRGLVVMSDILSLYDKVYLPRLSPLSHSVDHEGNLQIFSHGEIGTNTMSSLAQHFHRRTPDTGTIAATVELIDFNNQAFHQQRDNLCCKRGLEGGLYHPCYIGAPLSPKSAMTHLVWRRSTHSHLPIETPHEMMLSPQSALRRTVTWFHGHDKLSTQTAHHHIHTLDSESGLPCGEGAANALEDYIDLVSDNVPFSMLRFVQTISNLRAEYLIRLPATASAALEKLFSQLFDETFRFVLLSRTMQTVSIFDNYLRIKESMIRQMAVLLTEYLRNSEQAESSDLDQYYKPILWRINHALLNCCPTSSIDPMQVTASLLTKTACALSASPLGQSVTSFSGANREEERPKGVVMSNRSIRAMSARGPRVIYTEDAHREKIDSRAEQAVFERPGNPLAKQSVFQRLYPGGASPAVSERFASKAAGTAHQQKQEGSQVGISIFRPSALRQGIVTSVLHDPTLRSG